MQLKMKMIDELNDLRLLAEKNHVPIIRRDTETFLRKLLRKNKPKTILEVGTCIGYSALFFCRSCPKSKIVSIDNDSYASEAALYNISNFTDIDNLQLITGDGAKEMKRLNKTGDRFDFIFIDAGKSHYLRFFLEAKNILTPGGIILCDDIGQRNADYDNLQNTPRKHRTAITKMNEFIEHIKNVQGYKTDFYDIGDGLVTIKSLEDEQN